LWYNTEDGWFYRSWPKRFSGSLLTTLTLPSGLLAGIKKRKGIVMSGNEQSGNVFQEYFINVFTKKYAIFQGRARRKEYWFFYLFYTIISIVLSLLAQNSQAVAMVLLLYNLAAILPGMGLTCRRLHDIGRSGWWMLVALIPIVGAIVLLVWMCLDSQPDSNQYGPNPKGI
jgi:uncharacterized membrane protein YhaH (DUF805 family)